MMNCANPLPLNAALKQPVRRRSAVPGAVLLLAAALALGGCDKPVPVEIITPVKVQKVGTSGTDSSLTYSGQIVPDTSLDLAFSADGYIVEIAQREGINGKPRLIQPGDLVAAGEVLARVDDEKYRDRVATAQANVEIASAAFLKAQQDWSRATALKETDSITGPDFDAARQEYSTAQASVAGAQAQLDEAQMSLANSTLTSPLSGVINQRNIEIGSLVRPGTVGFVLANTESVKAVFGIPEAVLGEVGVGTALPVSVVAMPGRTFAGTVTQVAPAADQRTRIFEVSVSVDNPQSVLRQGMVASVVVGQGIQASGTLMVPMNSIVSLSAGAFAVYTIKDDGDQPTVHLTPITTSEVVGNSVVVTSGLTSGATIVVTGVAQITDGQTVNIQD